MAGRNLPTPNSINMHLNEKWRDRTDHHTSGAHTHTSAPPKSWNVFGNTYCWWSPLRIKRLDIEFQEAVKVNVKLIGFFVMEARKSTFCVNNSRFPPKTMSPIKPSDMFSWRRKSLWTSWWKLWWYLGYCDWIYWWPYSVLFYKLAMSINAGIYMSC